MTTKPTLQKVLEAILQSKEKINIAKRLLDENTVIEAQNRTENTNTTNKTQKKNSNEHTPFKSNFKY